MLYDHQTDWHENYNISGVEENVDIINTLRMKNLENRTLSERVINTQ